MLWGGVGASTGRALQRPLRGDANPSRTPRSLRGPRGVRKLKSSTVTEFAAARDPSHTGITYRTAVLGPAGRSAMYWIV